MAGLMPQRILVCGSRVWSRRAFMEFALLDLVADGDTIVTGGARGADRMAEEFAKKHSLALDVYRADWKAHGRKAGPIRNQEMLDSGVDLVAAFRPAGEKTPGTDDMVRRARKAGVPVLEYEA